MSPRYAPAERLLVLGLALAEARGGLSLDEMAEHLGVTRRTAERLRDSLQRVIPGGLTCTMTDDGRKRWRVPRARLGPLAAPALEELLELRLAADRSRQQGLAREAARLDALAEKLEASQPRERYRRVQNDLTDLLQATGVVVRPGPQEIIAPTRIEQLREAVLANSVVRLVYRRRDTGQCSYPVLHPYGFLTGARAYLVGFNPHPEVEEHRLYAIANIERIQLTGEQFVRDAVFDLAAFAARSFGAFWDGEQFDVLWRFSAEVAADVRGFRFHPDQRIATEADGAVTVAFRASGLTEMAWHLFTWGEHVEVLAPDALKERYRACLASAAYAVPIEAQAAEASAVPQSCASSGEPSSGTSQDAASHGAKPSVAKNCV